MSPSAAALASGIAAGAAVAAFWILPEYSQAYRDFCIIGPAPAPGSPSPVGTQYSPEACGWLLFWAKLAGSSLAIAPAEELFFRFFLYRRLVRTDWTHAETGRGSLDISALLWSSGLFALEHNRIVAAFAAGAVYCAVYSRRGFFAAALAHALTNFIIGLYVLETGAWAFW